MISRWCWRGVLEEGDSAGAEAWAASLFPRRVYHVVAPLHYRYITVTGLIMSSRRALPYRTALAAERHGTFCVFPVGGPQPP